MSEVAVAPAQPESEAAAGRQVQQNHDFMNLLGELESRFAVDDWRVDSVRVWPVARMHLYYGFFEHQFFANQPARAGVLQAGHVPRVARRMAGSAWRFVQASIADFRSTHHRNRPHDALLLNYQTYMTLLNGRWYSRVCDPFVEQLSAKGWSSFMLTAGYDYATPRFTKSRFVQPHLAAHRLMGVVRRPPRVAVSPMLGELEARAKASGLFHHSFALLDPVWRHASQIGSISRYFARVLTAVRPKVVFVSCWYGTESMACILACHRLGIPTVDIQHGSQEFHVAYDRWNRFPTTGYELLPTYFWCWSEREASVIGQWARRLSCHQPIAGSNLFLDRWIRGADDTVRAYDSLLARLKSPAADRLHVLYTLNGSTREEIKTIGDIVEAVNNSGLRCHFWIRLHPIALDQKARVRKELDDRGLQNVDVENATTLPLYALLRHMDVHVTEFSSVVIEAQAFGVPSVTGEQGAIWFPSQVATGWAVMAQSIPEWVSAIRGQLSRRAALAGNRPEAIPSSNNSLDELLRRVARPTSSR